MDRRALIIAWLSQVHLAPDTALAFHTHFLADPDPKLRVDATRLIAKLGPQASNVVANLEFLLQDPKLVVRKYAAKALTAIQPESSEMERPGLGALEIP